MDQYGGGGLHAIPRECKVLIMDQYGGRGLTRYPQRMYGANNGPVKFDRHFGDVSLYGSVYKIVVTMELLLIIELYDVPGNHL